MEILSFKKKRNTAPLIVLFQKVPENLVGCQYQIYGIGEIQRPWRNQDILSRPL